MYKAAASKAASPEATTSGDSTSTRAGSGLAEGDSPRPAPGNTLLDSAQAKPGPTGAVCAAVVISQPQAQPQPQSGAAQEPPLGNSRPFLTPQLPSSAQQAAQAKPPGQEGASRKRQRASSPDADAAVPTAKAPRAAAEPARAPPAADSVQAARPAGAGREQVPSSPATAQLAGSGPVVSGELSSTPSRLQPAAAAAVPSSPAQRCAAPLPGRLVLQPGSLEARELGWHWRVMTCTGH